MSIYKDLQQEAFMLIKEYGQSMHLYYEDGSKVTIKGVFVQAKTQEGTSSIDTFIANQRECVIQGKLRKAPTVGSHIVANKERYYVSAVESVSPTSTPLIYRLTLNN